MKIIDIPEFKYVNLHDVGNAMWIYHLNIKNYIVDKNNFTISIDPDDVIYNQIILNFKGEIHNKNGYAFKCHNVHKHFYLNNVLYSTRINEFAEKTKHLICIYCNDFCKQECF